MKLRKRRRDSELFPSSPYFRTVHQQVADLLPAGCQDESRDQRKSFPLDRKHTCRLSMEPIIK